jgi:hypothetical protein
MRIGEQCHGPLQKTKDKSRMMTGSLAFSRLALTFVFRLLPFVFCLPMLADDAPCND